MRTSKLLLTILTSSALATSTLTAQETPSTIRGWTFGATGFGLLWTDQEAAFDALAGPAFQLGYVTPRGLGFDFRAGYFLPTGRYDLNGVSGILGVSYAIPLGPHLFQVKAGATGLVGGDSDGSQGGGGGGYGGIGIVLRLAGRLGIQGDLLARYLQNGDRGVFAPSAAVGLVLLPR